jgi:hypothetical protein
MQTCEHVRNHVSMYTGDDDRWLRKITQVHTECDTGEHWEVRVSESSIELLRLVDTAGVRASVGYTRSTKFENGHRTLYVRTGGCTIGIWSTRTVCAK